MERTENVTDTVFVVKEDQEFCFLFDRDDPIDLYRALFRCAERPDSGLSREEVFEVIEGMVPERLRSI
jgi:IS5 family transposase